MKTGGKSSILGQNPVSTVAQALRHRPRGRTRHAALNADQPASSVQQSLAWLLAVPPAAPRAATRDASAPISPLREHRHPLANREIELAGVRIGFHHAHAKRRSIGMSVGPQGLQVRAPRWVTQAQLQTVLRERGQWIVDKLQQQLARVANQEPAQRWGHGHSVQVLGREVLLRSQPTARAGRSATANASLVRLNAQPADLSGVVKAAEAAACAAAGEWDTATALAHARLNPTGEGIGLAASAEAQDIVTATAADARLSGHVGEYSSTSQEKLAAIPCNTMQDQLDWIAQVEASPSAQSAIAGAPRAQHGQPADAPRLGELPCVDALAPANSPAPANGAAPAASAPASPQLALDVALPADAPEAQWQAAVLRWLQTLARRHFTARLDQLAPVLGVRWSRLSLTNARTRWGSASSDGSIRLHWRLMQLAPELADYVIVHELAHLHEMNHSPRFWAIVAAAMPDYQRHQQALKQIRLAPLD